MDRLGRTLAPTISLVVAIAACQPAVERDALRPPPVVRLPNADSTGVSGILERIERETGEHLDSLILTGDSALRVVLAPRAYGRLEYKDRICHARGFFRSEFEAVAKLAVTAVELSQAVRSVEVVVQDTTVARSKSWFHSGSCRTTGKLSFWFRDADLSVIRPGHGASEYAKAAGLRP